ncbi:MAG: hypothetical protein AABW54_02945 [Candidatus Micrarchaeota archaeon]
MSLSKIAGLAGVAVSVLLLLAAFTPTAGAYTPAAFSHASASQISNVRGANGYYSPSFSDMKFASNPWQAGKSIWCDGGQSKYRSGCVGSDYYDYGSWSQNGYCSAKVSHNDYRCTGGVYAYPSTSGSYDSGNYDSSRYSSGTYSSPRASDSSFDYFQSGSGSSSASGYARTDFTGGISNNFNSYSYVNSFNEDSFNTNTYSYDYNDGYGNYGYGNCGYGNCGYSNCGYYGCGNSYYSLAPYSYAYYSYSGYSTKPSYYLYYYRS